MFTGFARERNKMTEPTIFDCWTAYGIRPGMDPAERYSLEHLLADLDHYGVAGALVRHEQAYYYDPMHANRRLTREIRAHRDRLFPCWTVMPHQAGDFPEPGELAGMMEAENIRAVCLRPSRNGFPLHEDVLGPLAEMLNARRTVILTTIGELGSDYERAVRFCRIFGACPVIIGDAYWSQWRLMVAIMDACANARMECHLFQANRAVEFLAGRYGAERVLFGSGLIAHSAGAARGFVDWSLMNEKDVAKFAGGNLAELLGQGPEAAETAAEADEIVRAVRSGKPVPIPVLDAHCHVLDEGLNGGGVEYVMLKGDVTHMLELTRRSGIDLTAMMSWNGTVSMDVEAGNKLMEEVVRAAPEEVVGLSSCNPVVQSAEEIRAMCRLLHLELGFRGMKPYWTNRVSYADERYGPYWEFCNEHKLYGLLHVSPEAGGIEAVSTLAERYPEATFLIAHSGGSWDFARQVAEVANKYPNVCAELTLTPVPNGIVEWLCETIGVDRVLFGTDAPMRDPRPQVGWCVYTRLGEAEKRKILGENFARILRLGALPGHELPAIILKMK
jgi:predicted TIM-barrel fold metal-dependent hydrolase